MFGGNIRGWQIAILALLIILIWPLNADDSQPAPITIEDHGGRSITLPKSVEKVYATTEAGSFLVYALNPQSLVGWNRGLSPQLEFAVAPTYHELPTVGTWDLEYQTACPEKLAELAPDLIIHYAPADRENISLADEIGETLNIPAILIDNKIKTLPEALRLLGGLLNKEVRGQALATFAGNQLRQAEHFLQIRALYNPIPVHIVSPHPPGYFDQLLQFAGMVEMPLWSDEPPFPDLVLIMPHQIIDPYRAIEEDGHKRIYQIPSFPADWLDPGSMFGLLGIEWLHSIAYPHSYPGNLPETYQAFMEVFFEINITPDMLAWTLRRSGISF